MNYMKQIAKILGVEVEEIFKIKGFNYRYKITDEGVFCNFNSKNWFNMPLMLEELLVEEKEIVKLSYQPEKYKTYYTYKSDWTIAGVVWLGNFDDLSNKSCGTVFETEKEALQARPKVYKELTGREWEW